MLETEMLWRRGKPTEGAYKERRRKVKLSMNRVKQVLGQRAAQELNPVKQAEMKKLIHLM